MRNKTKSHHKIHSPVFEMLSSNKIRETGMPCHSICLPLRAFFFYSFTRSHFLFTCLSIFSLANGPCICHFVPYNCVGFAVCAKFLQYSTVHFIISIWLPSSHHHSLRRMSTNGTGYTTHTHTHDGCRLSAFLLLLLLFHMRSSSIEKHQKRCGTYLFLTICDVYVCVCSTTDISYGIILQQRQRKRKEEKKNIICIFHFNFSRFVGILFPFRVFFLFSTKFPAFLCFIFFLL